MKPLLLPTELHRNVRETGIEPALRPSPATTAGLFSVLPVKLLPGVLRPRLVRPWLNVLLKYPFEGSNLGLPSYQDGALTN